VVERLLVLDFGRVIGIGDPAEIMASKEVREIYLGMEV
jgi:branched-chain amino acid transport system ATP-binding protein